MLRVPGLRLRPLPFATEPAATGDDAIVVGYPEDGPFFAGPARIRDRMQIRGPDIYDDRTVTREVYSIYGDVRSGNSGGPLLAPDGSVYGVIFAAAVDQQRTGFALTAAEVADDARPGRPPPRRCRPATAPEPPLRRGWRPRVREPSGSSAGGGARWTSR